MQVGAHGHAADDAVGEHGEEHPIDGMTRPSRSRVAATRNDPIAIASVGMPMRPLNSRFTCSMAVWSIDTSTNDSSLQFGQSSQPSPLP